MLFRFPVEPQDLSGTFPAFIPIPNFAIVRQILMLARP
jgi:hypothetical protein